MNEINRKLNEEDQDTQKDKYLTFFLGEEIYGIEIMYVTEIIGLQAITKIPEQPNYMKGIVNLRGKIIPIMDVRLRFGKDAAHYNSRTCIIVINIADSVIGLIVDSVAEVLSISEQDIATPPHMNHIENKFIKFIGKVGNEIKLILDCEKLTETPIIQCTELL